MSGLSAAVVGRVDEVGRLRGLTREAVSGRGAAVLVEGEPGIGKTALLDVVAMESAALGMRVLRGAANEREQRLPFAAIASCLGLPARPDDPVLTRAAGLLRGDATALAVAGAADREFVVTEAVLDLVDRWCAAGPVALLIDDLQWADAASLLVLNRLGRTIGELPLLVVAACRPMPRMEGLDALLRGLDARGAVSLTLGPLTERAVAELVGGLVGAPPARSLLVLLAGAAGNPLYVTELVDALSRAGRIRIANGLATVVDAPGAPTGDAPLPDSLVGAIARRLDFLSGTAREVLRVAAVLGPGLNITELSTVLATPVIGLWEVVTEAVHAGLLTESGDELVFRHELIRQALAEELSPADRQALQATAARALAASGAPVERVAQRLVSGNGLDASMLDWLVQAGDALLVRAPAVAVDLLERALRQADADPVLRLQFARALLWAGRAAEAEEAARAALAGTHDVRQGAALRWLIVQASFRQGKVDEAISAAEQAATSAGLPAPVAARFDGFIAQCLLLLGHIERADEAATRALAQAEASADRYGTAYGLYIKAAVRLMEQRQAEGLELADRALDLLGTHEIQPDLQMAPQVVRGFCLMELDRLAESDAAFEAGMRHRDRGGRAFLTWHFMGRARVRFLDGRWDDALAEIQAGLEAVDPLGMAQGLLSQAALIAMHRGDFTTYPAVVAQPDTELAGRYWDFLRLSVQALDVERAGRPDQALHDLMEFWIRGEHELPQPIKLNYVCIEIARLSAIVGDPAPARRVGAALAELARRHDAPSILAVGDLCHGVADRDAVLLLRAAETYRQVGRPLYEGYACETAATVLAEDGRITEARAAWDVALERYEKLDAAWDVDRAGARLRQAGMRRRGSRRPSATGWDALTETERSVAELVVQGRSNPDIAVELYMSRRTVQGHVSRILAKLGLNSRVDLAIRAAATHKE